MVRTSTKISQKTSHGDSIYIDFLHEDYAGEEEGGKKKTRHWTFFHSKSNGLL